MQTFGSICWLLQFSYSYSWRLFFRLQTNRHVKIFTPQWLKACVPVCVHVAFTLSFFATFVCFQTCPPEIIDNEQKSLCCHLCKTFWTPNTWLLHMKSKIAVLKLCFKRVRIPRKKDTRFGYLHEPCASPWRTISDHLWLMQCHASRRVCATFLFEIQLWIAWSHTSETRRQWCARARIKQKRLGLDGKLLVNTHGYMWIQRPSKPVHKYSSQICLPWHLWTMFLLLFIGISPNYCNGRAQIRICNMRIAPILYSPLALPRFR